MFAMQQQVRLCLQCNNKFTVFAMHHIYTGATRCPASITEWCSGLKAIRNQNILYQSRIVTALTA
jgi:hypothetical protein